MIVQCLTCKRVCDINADPYDETVWRTPTADDLRQKISHGYCKPCADIELAKFDDDIARIKNAKHN